MSFNNKVVIVTGSGSGIGEATALEFAKQGANVVLVGRTESKLKNVADKCSAVGKAPLLVTADVGKDEDARRIIKDTIEKYGKLDVLVNNAAINDGTVDVLDSKKYLEAYDKTLNINLRGVVHLSVLAAPHLIKTKGNIINVSSATASIAFTLATVYSVSKAALDHFTKCNALELAPYGVRVNTIRPGPVMTEMMDNFSTQTPIKIDTPMGRLMNSEEIADFILYVASDRAKGITGSVLLQDCGWSLNP